MTLLVACGLALGVFAVLWRMTHGDPYAWTRPKIWSACLGALAERPWLGYGPGGFAPLAPAFAFEDPGAVARFSRTFHGPHSDLMGLFLALGIPGGLLALGMLAAAGRRLFRQAGATASMVSFGALAALAALGAHGLVDDLFGERPAMWVVAALLLGAAWGGLRHGDAGRGISRSFRVVLTVGVLVAFVAGEAVPWAADRCFRAGMTGLALRLEPRSPVYRLAVAREAKADSAERLAEGLDHLQRALLERGFDAAPWIERARLLSAACHGLLTEEGICREAGVAWSAALARAPRDVFARRARARFRVSLGARRQAEDDLRLALETEPNYLAARIDLVRLLGEMGEFTAAGRELTILDDRAEELLGVRPGSFRGRELLRYSPSSLATARRAAAGDEGLSLDGQEPR